MAPKKPEGEFSDSDRAALDAFLEEREHEAWLEAKRKKRYESARGWVQWVVSAGAAFIVLKDVGAVAWKLLLTAIGMAKP